MERLVRAVNVPLQSSYGLFDAVVDTVYGVQMLLVTLGVAVALLTL